MQSQHTKQYQNTYKALNIQNKPQFISTSRQATQRKPMHRKSNNRHGSLRDKPENRSGQHSNRMAYRSIFPIPPAGRARKVACSPAAGGWAACRASRASHRGDGRATASTNALSFPFGNHINRITTQHNNKDIFLHQRKNNAPKLKQQIHPP